MKTRPYITERLLMGRKESNQTNKQNLKADHFLNHMVSQCVNVNAVT